MRCKYTKNCPHSVQHIKLRDEIKRWRTCVDLGVGAGYAAVPWSGGKWQEVYSTGLTPLTLELPPWVPSLPYRVCQVRSVCVCMCVCV